MVESNTYFSPVTSLRFFSLNMGLGDHLGSELALSLVMPSLQIFQKALGSSLANFEIA